MSPKQKAQRIVDAQERASLALGGDDPAVLTEVRKIKARGAVRRYKRRRQAKRTTTPQEVVGIDRAKNKRGKTLTKALKLSDRQKKLMRSPPLPSVRSKEQLRLKDMLISFMSEPEIPGETPDGLLLTNLQRQVIRFDRVLHTLYTKAIEGDVGMMKIIMDRVMPVHKTGELELKITAEEHRSFLDRFRYGDNILRFGNEVPLIDGDFQEKQDKLMGSVQESAKEVSPIEEEAEEEQLVLV